MELGTEIFRQVTDAAQEGICTIDLQGIVTYANPKLAEMVGHRAGDLIGRPMTEFLDEDTGASLRQVLLICPEETRRQREHSLRTRDGTLVPVLTTSSPLRDAAGRCIGRVAVLSDRTERMRLDDERRLAETKLARANALLESVIEATPVAVLTTDLEGRVVMWNKAAEEIFGWTREEALGQVLPYNDPEHSSLRAETRRKVIEERAKIHKARIRGRRKTGQSFSAQFSVAPLMDSSGAVSAVVLAIVDLSDYEAVLAQAAHSDRLISLGTLAAGIAHEVNNPLSYCMNHIELALEDLERGNLDQARVDGVSERLRKVLGGAHRVAEIVRGLKVFSRCDDPAQEVLRLRDCLNAALELAGHQVRPTAVLSAEVGEELRVKGNSARLTQVFLNLVINAVQAFDSPDPSRNRIEIRSERRPGEVALMVRDNGRGMSAEVLDRVFEPFFTTKKVGEGTGLGLSVCHGIIRQMGGRIEVTSRPGEGSVFSVVLPEWIPEAGTRPRIVLVDDEAELAKCVAESLGRIADVLLFTEAREALKAIESEPRIDLVLCDVMMPGMSGVQMLEAIRLTRPDLADRWVFMTGGSFTMSAVDAQALRSRPCLEKPFTMRQARDLVLSLLSS